MRMAEGVPISNRWPVIPLRMWTTGGLSKILECEYAKDVDTKLLQAWLWYRGHMWSWAINFSCRAGEGGCLHGAPTGRSITEDLEILSELHLPNLWVVLCIRGTLKSYETDGSCSGALHESGILLFEVCEPWHLECFDEFYQTWMGLRRQ